ncbi:MAG TPA: hypothetical protein VFP55_09545 [Solirubrobacteraceae bacterium]|nr:hypothetical protein [Solirubrobacteraceae bacterium]
MTPIIALIVAAGVAACGSTGSGATSAPGTATAAGPSGSATAAATTGTSGSSTTLVGSASASTQKQVGTQAELILRQLSSTTTQLATGRISPTQARAQLRTLRSQSLQLVKNARRLAPTSPTRAAILSIGNEAAAYAGHLQQAQVTAQSRQALRQSARALSSLEAQVRGLVSHAKTPSLNQITADLQVLQRQATG